MASTFRGVDSTVTVYSRGEGKGLGIEMFHHGTEMTLTLEAAAELVGLLGQALMSKARRDEPWVNADLGRMARSLMDQADVIPDEDPLANYRKSSLRDAAAYLLRAFSELTDLDQWEQEADQERGERLMQEEADVRAGYIAGFDEAVADLAKHREPPKWECQDCGVKGLLPMPGQCPNPTCRSVALVTP